MIYLYTEAISSAVKQKKNRTACILRRCCHPKDLQTPTSCQKASQIEPPKWRKRRRQQPPKSTSKIGTTNRRKLAGNNPRATEATRKSRQQGGENTRASKKSEALRISLLNGRSRCGLVDADLEDEGTGGVSQVERVGCGVMKTK